MSRRSMNTAAAKEARKARREAKRAARAASASASSSFPGSSHIKRNTHGTSNEISFSVLDAMKNNVTGASGKKVNGVPTTPRTMAELAAEKARDEAHASLGISSSAEEASRRSSKRLQQRPFRIAGIIGGCVAAICAIVFVAVVGVHLSEPQQNELTAAVDAIEEADSTLFAFDGIVVGAMSSSLADMAEQGVPERYDLCQPTLVTVEEQIDQARSLIQQIQPTLTSDADREAAAQMLETLNVREDMIAAGERAMNETVVLIDLYEQVDAGWNGLLDADALARDAAALSAYTTPATLEAALAKTDEAINAFALVRDQFVQAREDVAEQRAYQASIHPAEGSTNEGGDGEAAAEGEVEAMQGASEGASGEASEEPQGGDADALALLTSLDDALAHYLEYIELRINAQYEAKRSTQAVIDHDSAVAQEANDTYNLLDSRAVSHIRGNVEQLTDYVSQLFDLEREGLFSPYDQARLRASEHDAYLGDYLASLGR